MNQVHQEIEVGEPALGRVTQNLFGFIIYESDFQGYRIRFPCDGIDPVDQIVKSLLGPFSFREILDGQKAGRIIRSVFDPAGDRNRESRSVFSQPRCLVGCLHIRVEVF